MASSAVGVRPPCVHTRNRAGALWSRRSGDEAASARASMLSTMHWLPKRAAASDSNARAVDGRGVDAHLVRTGAQNALDVRDLANAAAHGERDEQALGRAPHYVQQGASPFDGCR